MQNLWISLILLSSIFLFRANAFAERVSPPMGVTISCACADPIGQAYVNAVKDLLQKDTHYQQMSMEEGARRGAIRVHIISMPLEESEGKPRAALSVVYMHEGVMVHQFIETCTHLPVQDCALALIRGLREVED